MDRLRSWINEQGRTRLRWTMAFFVLLLLTLSWPTADGVQSQAKTAILWLWSFGAVFQFGRLLQTWSARPLLLTSSSLSPEIASEGPPWATAPKLPPAASSGCHYVSSQIRCFASIEEARENGWSFDEPIAWFGDRPVPASASFEGASYDYTGLSPSGNFVPPDMRVFGTLAYRRRQEPPLQVA